MAQHSNLNSTIEQIAEKVTNLDHRVAKAFVKDAINEATLTYTWKERQLRLSTLTIEIPKKLTNEEIIKLINKEWESTFHPTNWYDKTNIFIKFLDEKQKQNFISKLIATKKESGKIAE